MDRQKSILINVLISLHFFITASFGWALSPNTSLSSASASYIGENAGDESGYSIAIVEDVNGDGYDDIVVGAYMNSDNGPNAGKAYLIFGKKVAWTMDNLLENADASFLGETDEDWAGFNVAGAGDVNGDGLNDILISAHGNDDAGEWAGKVYLILGKESGWVLNTDLALADASFLGENEGDYAGYAIASAGDVNNDGLADILIGAPFNNSAFYHAGKSYIIFGRETGWTLNMSLARADASFVGEGSDDDTGRVVASAGNVNNDEYDDILIATPDWEYGMGGLSYGKTYLILGKATGEWEHNVSLSLADASFIGEASLDNAARSTGVGDVNGDGYDDISIGAPFNNDGGADAGKAYLIFGKETGWARDADLSTADASFIGEAMGDSAGANVSPAGDVNGDGYADLLIGANLNDDAGDRAGKTYLVFGKETGWMTDTPLSSADASFIGESLENFSGFGISGGKDANNDGYSDFLIGAFGNAEGGGPETGQTYLILSDYAPPPCTVWVDDDWAGSHPNDIVDGHIYGYDAFAYIQHGVDAVCSPGRVHVADGTYYETITLKPQLRVYGAGARSTSIDGRRAGTVVTAIGIDHSSSFSGFTITNGRSSSGGGMYIRSSFLKITNCIITGNTTTTGPGAGITNEDHSSPTFSNCYIGGNSTRYGTGGGLYNHYYSSPKLVNCTFEDNSALYGGGMYNYRFSSPILTGCRFINNTADNSGGGMYNSYYGNADLRITHFTNNTSLYGNGGGIYTYYSTPTIVNGYFNNNSAVRGGAIYNYRSSPIITNCTLYGNTASLTGGGLYNGNSSPEVTNSILWNDVPNEIVNAGLGAPVVTYSDIEGGYPGIGNKNDNPNFVNAPVGDFHLRSGSDCIDSGTNGALALPSVDFEGNDRVLDGDGIGGAVADMGVDEVKTPGVLKNLVSSDFGFKLPSALPSRK